MSHLMPGSKRIFRDEPGSHQIQLYCSFERGHGLYHLGIGILLLQTPSSSPFVKVLSLVLEFGGKVTDFTNELIAFHLQNA